MLLLIYLLYLHDIIILFQVLTINNVLSSQIKSFAWLLAAFIII